MTESMQYARLSTRTGEPLMLLGAAVTGDLDGPLFEARLEQRFHNPADRHVEIVYTFVLPFGAVLLDVEVVLGGRRLGGAVIEKKAAQADYEDALAEGNAAILLEHNHDGSYSLELGNLAPDEDCTITIRYAQALRFEQRGLRLLVPTVIAPRYGDAVHDGGLAPHQATETSLSAEYPFDLCLRLHGELAGARIASPSHPIRIAHTSEAAAGILEVSLAREASLDRDFILVIDQLRQDSIAVLGPDATTPGARALVASFCPRIEADGPAALAVKLLVDCSGSMGGDSIAAARRALQAIAGQLRDGDRFSLSRFGSRVEHRSRSLWKLTEATRLAARRWIGALEADLCGTEMRGALESTFALEHRGRSDVLLITDGEIHAIDRVIEAARSSGHRVFVVGIGSSPVESHLRRIAEATGGACDFVAPGEAVEPAVLRMFARLRSPHLSALTLDWPAGCTPTWVSPLPTAIFDADTVTVFALLPGPLEGSLGLHGRRGDAQGPEPLGSIMLDDQPQASDMSSRLVAAARVDRLLASASANLASDGTDESDASRESEDLRTQATRLAVSYRLVSECSSFLLVEERAEADKPADMPVLHKVPQMMPAGWSGAGSVGDHLSIDRLIVNTSMAPTPNAYRRPSRIHPAPDAGLDLFELPQLPELRDGHLTPLGFATWLRGKPRTDWPSTYDGLRSAHIDARLIDWLELVIAARQDGAWPEAEVVAAFVEWMSRHGSGDAPASQADASGATGELLAKIGAALAGMDTTDWPKEILSAQALDTVTG